MGFFSNIIDTVKDFASPILGGIGTAIGGPIGGMIGTGIGGLFESSGGNDPVYGGGYPAYNPGASANPNNWLNTIGTAVNQNLPSIIAGGANYWSQSEQNEEALKRMRESNQFSASQSRLANQFTASQAATSIAETKALAQRQQDFQERMSNTAYKRSMADLKSAGLNPILAYAKAGASTPSGGTGSMAAGTGSRGSPTTIPPVSELGPALSTALQVKRLEQDLDSAQKTIDQQEQNIRTSRSTAQVNAQQAALLAEKGRTQTETTKKEKANAAEAALRALDYGAAGDSVVGRQAISARRMHRSAKKTVAPSLMNLLRSILQ